MTSRKPRCMVCKRPLRDPKSIQLGIGPTCRGKRNRATSRRGGRRSGRRARHPVGRAFASGSLGAGQNHKKPKTAYDLILEGAPSGTRVELVTHPFRRSRRRMRRGPVYEKSAGVWIREDGRHRMPDDKFRQYVQMRGPGEVHFASQETA